MVVIERLAALTTLASIPRTQLEWLAAHGEIQHFDAGEIMFSPAQPIPNLYVVLSGRFSIRVDRGGVTRKVKEWKAGDISGRLPYSRMTNPPGVVVADEPLELLMIASDYVRDMACECYEFTSLCVHEMVDRARAFKSDDLQREKMASLGLLSAGLAHELNNPSSAVARSAKELTACRVELAAASRDLGATGLTGQQLAAVTALETTAESAPGEPHSPLARADREDDLSQWLDNHGVDAGLAEPLANTAVTVADLDAAAAALTGRQLAVGLRYLAAHVTASRLTAEIENAASRIHSLVAAVKKHTHMDRAPVIEAVPLEGNLADTLMLIGSKARRKSVTLELKVDANLPAVQGVIGELNQVWLNLIDRIVATPNIKLMTHIELTAVCGSGHLERINVKHVDSGATESLDAAAVFIFIGVAPRTGAFEGFVQTDDKGFIITGPDLRHAGRGWSLDRDPLMFETSVPGVFAAGDVRSGANRRIAAAVGEGSAAIFSVHQYLLTV